MRRLFIAINIPKLLKKNIEDAILDLRSRYDIEMKWTMPEYWHLAILFLGEQPDQAIGDIINAMKIVVLKFSAPIVALDKIILVPDADNPRMIWMVGTEESSRIIGEFKKDVENLLIENNIRFKAEERRFNAHINLARARSEELGGLDIEELQKNINEANLKLKKYFPLSFEAGSIDLMESHLERSGVKYLVLSEFKFK